MSIEHHTVSTVDYTLFQPDVRSEELVVYVPGMATNRYGQLAGDEPVKAVKEALVDVVGNTHTILFPDIWGLTRLGSETLIPSLTVEEQQARLVDVVDAVTEQRADRHITYVASCLGGNVVASLASEGYADGDCLLWAPTTSNWRQRFCDILGATEVDDTGTGLLPIMYGKKFLVVSKQFWDSAERNALHNHDQAMDAAFGKVVAFYPTQDSIFPENAEYLETRTPTFRRVPIEGNRHSFSAEPMRDLLRAAMQDVMFGEVA